MSRFTVRQVLKDLGLDSYVCRSDPVELVGQKPRGFLELSRANECRAASTYIKLTSQLLAVKEKEITLLTRENRIT